MEATVESPPAASREVYLEMESRTQHRSEFYNGEIFAMTGGSPRHSIVRFNVGGELREAIRDKRCTGFESNMKLEIPEASAFVYPDAMVVCGDVELAEDTTDAILNPVLVVEVLSPSTESFDRGGKFRLYRQVRSLAEYLLVSQEEPMVESYFKQEEGRWLYTVVKGLDAFVALQSLECQIPLRGIYLKVFP